MIRKSPAERLREKVTVSADGCHVFTGAKSPTGYGFLRVAGRNVYVHRLSYELAVGPIPEGLVIDHLCRNRACVNPEHLEPVTIRENTLRGMSIQAMNARKTHCKRGHELSGPNLRIDGTGRRICRQCKQDTNRRLRAA